MSGEAEIFVSIVMRILKNFSRLLESKQTLMSASVKNLVTQTSVLIYRYYWRFLLLILPNNKLASKLMETLLRSFLTANRK